MEHGYSFTYSAHIYCLITLVPGSRVIKSRGRHTHMATVLLELWKCSQVMAEHGRFVMPILTEQPCLDRQSKLYCKAHATKLTTIAASGPWPDWKICNEHFWSNVHITSTFEPRGAVSWPGCESIQRLLMLPGELYTLWAVYKNNLVHHWPRAPGLMGKVVSHGCGGQAWEKHNPPSVQPQCG